MSAMERTRAATEAMQAFAAAARPRTEAEYWDWLRYNDPLRYIVERRAARGARSPVSGLLRERSDRRERSEP